MEQNYPRPDLQRSQTVYGNEPEVVRRVHATVSTRTATVRSKLINQGSIKKLRFREQERQNQRQELWDRVHNLAKNSPEYELIIKQLASAECNNVITSPEGDDEVNLDNLEQEALQVSI